jgi:hypothetical protein
MALAQQQPPTLAGHALDFPPELFTLPAFRPLLLLFRRGHAHRGQRVGVARHITIQSLN